MSTAFDTDDLDSGFAKTKGTGVGGGLAKLPDGEYTFEIDSAELARPNDKTAIFRRKLIVLGGEYDGTDVPGDIFLKHNGDAKEMGLDQLKKELRLLGFDVDDWRPPDRSLGKELPKACAAMKGIRFVGKKKTNESNGKTYHNLYVENRVEGDGKPAKFGPDELNKAAKEDIPF